ncbi:MAG: 1-acyl-sn-glycerol-3-phosphate acyltransferase [Cyclobacteriaceae bacterium]|jgi:1-acyl-sn-glycerol-3-phosphate acyltransferase|nr:1-acyl-sn-glycerol-3-phosphate acyltransferase [Cyclobacteriaceae bacterium]
MKTVLLKLYLVWVFLVFTVFMLLFLPGILIPGLFGPRAVRVTYFFMKAWSWVFSMLTFIRYDIHHREKIVRGQAYIYVSNHTSFLDLPGIALTIRGQFRPLAKRELLGLPVFGWITRVTCVVVDRSSPQSRKRSIDKLIEILQWGISILIFPEGTQNKTREPLQPFHDGAFRIAIETQQALLPLVVLNAGNLMPPKKLFLHPGRIHIYVDDPIPTRGLTLEDIPVLKERVRATMFHLITRHGTKP